MKLPQDAAFRAERSRYALRFACEDCALFDDARERCAHGFPTDEHRAARYADSNAPLRQPSRTEQDTTNHAGGRAASVVFCKDFELV